MFVVIIQTVLFLAHWFLYKTWTAFWPTPDLAGVSKSRTSLGLALGEFRGCFAPGLAQLDISPCASFTGLPQSGSDS